MNKLIIIGASGHGKVVADIAEKCGYEDIAFVDDNTEIKDCAGFPVIGDTSHIKELSGHTFAVAIGDAVARRHFFNLLHNEKIATLIHPSAVISRRVCIGEGTVVMAGAAINSDTIIGKGCIINTGASVDHDGIIEDFVHISVGAHVAGTVHIMENTWIGAGAIVLNNISICEETIIGAGAVVTHDICISGKYIGIPAHLMGIGK